MSKILTSGMARLFEFLACVKHFPVPLRFASICSGIGEGEARRALEHSPFTVIDDQIVPQDELDRIGRMTVIEADELYRKSGISIYCKAGRPIWCNRETEGITDDRGKYGKGAYRGLSHQEIAALDAPPITHEAVERFFEEARRNFQCQESIADHTD